MSKPMRPIEDRLWDRVDRGDECWVWTGPTTNGYGVIGRAGRHSGLVRVHRLAYELLVGPIPSGLHIDHLCSNRVCVNPAHLEPVTQAENSRRAGERKTTCPQGHPLRPREPGKRRPACNACARARHHRRKEKKS